MGGKGGGGGTNWNEVAYNNAANAARQGQPLEVAIRNQPGYEEATRYAYSQVRPPSQPHSAGFEFPEIGAMHQPSAPAGPSYEEQMADQEARQREAEERQRRIQGENERDRLYSSYMDAASTATDYINAEISREMSNSALLGVDYLITDDIKSKRISDYFATVWGEGEQGRLEALMGEWGNPAGFGGFTVTRGDASTYAGTKGDEKLVGKSTTQKPKPTLVTEEEDTLGTATLLGA